MGTAIHYCLLCVFNRNRVFWLCQFVCLFRSPSIRDWWLVSSASSLLTSIPISGQLTFGLCVLLYLINSSPRFPTAATGRPFPFLSHPANGNQYFYRIYPTAPIWVIGTYWYVAHFYLLSICCFFPPVTNGRSFPFWVIPPMVFGHFYIPYYSYLCHRLGPEGHWDDTIAPATFPFWVIPPAFGFPFHCH